MGIPNLVIGVCVTLLIISGLANRRWLGLLITLAVNGLAWVGIFLTMPASPLVMPVAGAFFLLACLLFNITFGRYLTGRKDAWKDPTDPGWSPGPGGGYPNFDDED